MSRLQKTDAWDSPAVGLVSPEYTMRHCQPGRPRSRSHTLPGASLAVQAWDPGPCAALCPAPGAGGMVMERTTDQESAQWTAGTTCTKGPGQSEQNAPSRTAQRRPSSAACLLSRDLRKGWALLADGMAVQPQEHQSQSCTSQEAAIQLPLSWHNAPQGNGNDKSNQGTRVRDVLTSSLTPPSRSEESVRPGLSLALPALAPPPAALALADPRERSWAIADATCLFSTKTYAGKGCPDWRYASET